MPLVRSASVALVGAFLLPLGACSERELRDQNYGTDAGANYVLPDAAASEAAVAGDIADAGDAVTVDAASVDAASGGSADAQVADADAQVADAGTNADTVASSDSLASE